MKINIQMKTKLVPFGELSVGTVFRDEGCMYMRVDQINHTANTALVNTVDLETGGMYYTNLNDLVEPLDVELVLA